ncbi:MAG: hypothetical protein K8R36_09230 [Planctomycetales bacterium]|nr:hypothetical protein [Planctomycetales bacterium]
MTTAEIVERLEVMERELAKIKQEVLSSPKPGDWLSTVGMFAGDPDFKEVTRLGREWREQENRREL